eukprot:888636-Heterocapsa_arctica.AAC.1
MGGLDDVEDKENADDGDAIEKETLARQPGPGELACWPMPGRPAMKAVKAKKASTSGVQAPPGTRPLL